MPPARQQASALPACPLRPRSARKARLALTSVRLQMVLKDGGPCIALKKPARGSGPGAALVLCGKTSDHLWYAGPTCKGCYEKKNRKRKGAEGVATGIPIDPESLQEESQETLVEIEAVYASRCAPRACCTGLEHPSPWPPVPCCPVPNVPLSHPHDPRTLRRFSKVPLDRRERRNPIEEDEEELMYDVYGKFEYERENGKMAKAEWGRRWCGVYECAEVDDWKDKLEAYEVKLKAKREETEQTYG